MFESFPLSTEGKCVPQGKKVMYSEFDEKCPLEKNRFVRFHEAMEGLYLGRSVRSTGAYNTTYQSIEMILEDCDVDEATGLWEIL